MIELSHHFGTVPRECGYVSGLRERQQCRFSTEQKRITGTIAIPWFGEETPAFLQRLYTALANLKTNHSWHLYLDRSHSSSERFYQLFSRLPGCRIEPPGQRYTDSLLNSRCAIVYGGYNSLMDVLSLNLPALILLRDMQDNEQQLHLAKLQQKAGPVLKTVEEKCGAKELGEALNTLLSFPEHQAAPLNLDGATTAAEILTSYAHENS